MTRLSRLYDKTKRRLQLSWRCGAFEVIHAYLAGIMDYRPDIAPQGNLARSIQSVVDAARR